MMMTTMMLTTDDTSTVQPPTEPPGLTTTTIISIAAGASSALLALVAIGAGLYLWFGRRQTMAAQGQQKEQQEAQQRRQQEPKKPSIEDGKPPQSTAFFEAVGAARPRTWEWQPHVKKDRAHIVGDKRGSVDNLSKDMYCSSTSCYSLGYPYHNGAFTPQWGNGGGYSRKPASAIGNFGYDRY